MTSLRSSHIIALVGGALVAGLIAVAPGCTEECIDRFDCVGKGAAGEFLVCENNKCVPGTPPAVEDAGTEPDAGGGEVDAGTDAGAMDAGEMDAGATDAGEMDGGATDAGEMDAGMDAGAPVTYVANMTGAQEVPPKSSVGSGTASCTLDAAQTSLMCSVSLTGIVPTSSHIHNAHAGLNGGILFTFTSPMATGYSQTFTVTPADVQLLQDGRLYVNVHTTLNPGGEIRGQLLLNGEKLYSAQLDGGTNGNGSAGLIVNATGDTLTYDVTLNGASGVTASHIHNKADSSVLIGLPNVGNDGGFGTAPVTATEIGILDNDGGYLNVHGAGGAVIITGDVVKLQ